MSRMTSKLTKTIADTIYGIERMPPAEQLAAMLAVGDVIKEVGRESEVAEINAVSAVWARMPQLGTPEDVRRAVGLAGQAADDREFMLLQTATPMSDGRPLSPAHWTWLFRHCPHMPFGRHDWLLHQLAWLRRESPSAAVLDHVGEVLEGEYEREVDEVRSGVRDAIQMLEGL